MKVRYISILNSKGNIFFKRLRTATCWLTLRQILRICPSNLSLLSIVTPRSSISSWIGITVPSQVNTGFLSTLPKVIAWYFEWFLFIWLNSYHSSTFFRSAFMACSTWSISSADLNNWVPALFHIFTHWNCFLSSVATNGKNGYRLNPTL